MGLQLLGFGGTYAIESPAPYSPVAKRVISELGIDVSVFSRRRQRSALPLARPEAKIFFDRETFGADRLVVSPYPIWGPQVADPEGKLAGVCCAGSARKREGRLPTKRFTHSTPTCTWSHVGREEGRLARISYADYLPTSSRSTRRWSPCCRPHPQPLYGLGIDAVSAQDAWGLGLPGFNGLKLSPGPGPGMGRDAIHNEEAEAYFFHFPDGNSSIARLLVRSLIPKPFPAKRIGYRHRPGPLCAARSPGNTTRIRLNSTVVRVRHLGDPATAQRGGNLLRAAGQAEHGERRSLHSRLLARDDSVSHQRTSDPSSKTRFRSAEKVPIVYTNVAMRNWQASRSCKPPASTRPAATSATPASIIASASATITATTQPSEPIVLTMHRYPCSPGLPSREQHRAGREELYETQFRHLRAQHPRATGAQRGPGGFDPARDIAAITVNRWPHGYAYQYNSLWDPFWLEGGPLPCVTARKP